MKPASVLMFIAVACPLVALGQTTTAQLTGLVTDPSGSAVPAAVISATNVHTGIKADTASNELGYYTVPLLPPGNYKVTVQKDGFRPIAQSGITLNVNQTARIDFVMQVGEVKETVAVIADEELRAERAGGRGHEGLEGRASAQLSQDEKSQRADFTIPNDGTLPELEEKLSQLLDSL